MDMFFTKPLLKVLNFQIIDYFDLISVPFCFLIGSFKYIPRFQIKGDLIMPPIISFKKTYKFN